MRASWAIGTMLGVLSLGGSASAQLRVATAEGTWDATVRSLAERLDSEGVDVRVCVQREGTACLRCDEYAVALSDPAFEVSACDEATGETIVRLTDRPALFDHTSAVPRVRVPVLSASPTDAARAPVETARVIDDSVCTAEVQAFVRDVEHGSFIALTPERFTLRTDEDDVEVIAGVGRFVLARERGGAIRYAIVDRATGDVVLEGETAIDCPAAPVIEASEAVAVAPPVPATSGIRVRPTPPEREVARVFSNAGFALTAAGALGLVVSAGIFLWDLSVFACAFTLDPDPLRRPCAAAIPFPLEVPIASAVGLVVGLAVALPARLIESSVGGSDTRAALTLGGRF